MSLKSERPTAMATTDYRITTKEIEYFLLELIDKPDVRTGDRHLKRWLACDYVPVSAVKKILVNGLLMLNREPTLLEFDITDRCTVVGNLYGYVNDLLSILANNGMSKNHHYLFLGDYLGLGPRSVDVFLVALLMKLRWPKNIHLLRGHNEMPDLSGQYFQQACLRAYDQRTYFLFLRVFDALPLAAIVEDEIFCCHGGISQWMISREAISRIKKPITSRTATLLQLMLTTDILFADPNHDSNPIWRFVPNTSRSVSYKFSDEAISAVLRALGCKKLIRSHEIIAGGIAVNDAKTCYTVHSTAMTINRASRGSVITIKKHSDTGRVLVRTLANLRDSLPWEAQLFVLYESLRNNFEAIFAKCEPSEVEKYKAEDLFDHLQSTRTCESELRFLTHDHLMDWWLENVDLDRTPLDSKQFGMRYETYRELPLMFPVVYDIIAGKGASFREHRESQEDELLKRINGSDKAIEVVPLERWPNDRYYGTSQYPTPQDRREHLREGFRSWQAWMEKQGYGAAREKA